MQKKPVAFSLRLAFDFAWTTFKTSYRLFTAVMLTILLAWALLELAVIAGQGLGILFWAAVHLTFFIVFASIEVGLMRICLALHNGEQVSFSDTFSNIRLSARFLVGQLLYVTMVLAGLLLLILPGIYLGLRYSLFGFSLASGDTGLIASFQESARLGKDAGALLFTFFAFLFLLNLLGASLLGLGLIVTVPLSVLMTVSVVRQLGA